MNTRSIAVLKAILSEGSFQKAARRLNCSQSTITFQVRQLEDELSLRLFERMGRRMVLSQAGKGILPHMESILHSVRAIEEYRNGRHELAGKLRIAVSESLLSYKIHTVLEKFIKAAPRVRTNCTPEIVMTSGTVFFPVNMIWEYVMMWAGSQILWS